MEWKYLGVRQDDFQGLLASGIAKGFVGLEVVKEIGAADRGPGDAHHGVGGLLEDRCWPVIQGFLAGPMIDEGFHTLMETQFGTQAAAPRASSSWVGRFDNSAKVKFTNTVDSS